MATAKSVFVFLLWAIVTVTATDQDDHAAEMGDESDDDLQLDSIQPEMKSEGNSDSGIAEDDSNLEDGWKSRHRPKPWNKLSRKPFHKPSRKPSHKPSRKPSHKPSRKPSYKPSRIPFHKPSRKPWRRPYRRPWCLRCRHSKLCIEDSNCATKQYCEKQRRCHQYGCCRDRRASGRLCAADEQCLGRFCTVFRCGECREDGDCSAGQFCRNRNAPLLVKTCQNKTADGQVCNRNAMCASGNCVNFVCFSNCSKNSTVIMNLCEDDSNCSTGQYCKYRDFPVIPNNCTAKEPTGAVCTRNQQCSSGFCVRGRCSQCLVTGHCPKYRYCLVRRHFFTVNTCVKKKCRGRCHCNSECLTGKCFYRRCRPC